MKASTVNRMSQGAEGRAQSRGFARRPDHQRQGVDGRARRDPRGRRHRKQSGADRRAAPRRRRRCLCDQPGVRTLRRGARRDRRAERPDRLARCRRSARWQRAEADDAESLKGKNRRTRTRKPMPIAASLAKRLKQAAAGRDADRAVAAAMPDGERWSCGGAPPPVRRGREGCSACRTARRSIACGIPRSRARCWLACRSAGRVELRHIGRDDRKNLSKHIAHHGDEQMRRAVFDADAPQQHRCPGAMMKKIKKIQDDRMSDQLRAAQAANPNSSLLRRYMDDRELYRLACEEARQRAKVAKERGAATRRLLDQSLRRSRRLRRQRRQEHLRTFTRRRPLRRRSRADNPVMSATTAGLRPLPRRSMPMRPISRRAAAASTTRGIRISPRSCCPSRCSCSTAGNLRAWRDGLLAKGLKPSSVVRYCKSLRAALNLAASHDARIQNKSAWEVGLEALPDASGRQKRHP